MTGKASTAGMGRVVERRPAVAWRGIPASPRASIRQIAALLGRSPATVKAYFYDPTGEKARAVKARYVGVCRGCGAYTQPRNGKGDAYAYCKACHPGPIERRWTRERVLEARREWRSRFGTLPSSYDWSRTHARRRGGEALRRLREGSWPSASVVTAVCGSWLAARSAVGDAASSTAPASATYAWFAGIPCWPGVGARVIRVVEVPGSNLGAPIKAPQMRGFFSLGYPVL